MALSAPRTFDVTRSEEWGGAKVITERVRVDDVLPQDIVFGSDGMPGKSEIHPDDSTLIARDYQASHLGDFASSIVSVRYANALGAARLSPPPRPINPGDMTWRSVGFETPITIPMAVKTLIPLRDGGGTTVARWTRGEDTNVAQFSRVLVRWVVVIPQNQAGWDIHSAFAAQAGNRHVFGGEEWQLNSWNAEPIRDETELYEVEVQWVKDPGTRKITSPVPDVLFPGDPPMAFVGPVPPAGFMRIPYHQLVPVSGLLVDDPPRILNRQLAPIDATGYTSLPGNPFT